MHNTIIKVSINTHFNIFNFHIFYLGYNSKYLLHYKIKSNLELLIKEINYISKYLETILFKNVNSQ